MKRRTIARASEPGPATVRMEFSPAVIIAAVQKMKKTERDAFLEDLLAASSPEYLASIREARAQHRAGKLHSFEETFDR